MKLKPSPARTITKATSAPAIAPAPITEIPTEDAPSVTQASNNAQVKALNRSGRRSTILSRRRSESGGRNNYDNYGGTRTGTSA